MQKDLSKYTEVFISEAKGLIETMNKSLLTLEKSPTKVELVNDMFRNVHTLKGMADTMNYQKTVRLCHALEDVLDLIRKKRLKPDTSVDTLFECIDTLERTIKSLRDAQDEIDATALVEKLRSIAAVEGSKAKPSEKKSASSSETISQASAVEKISSIEVKVQRLDLLMNLAEELLINRMRLDRIKDDLQDPELTAVTDTLSRLIADVQYTVMQVRMVPIGFVFDRFPRMVRDLAKQQGKQVDLEMEGTDIELDREVLDEIGECLVHLLRNAVDHGIEKPEERKKAGKDPQGSIKLTASRIKDSALIEVADDGAGLDFEEIKKTAIKRGILSPGASQEEVMDSIFSGLSTTKQVTAVSGRGFGLNIVRNKVVSLSGTVNIESTPKKGSRFIIEMPVTLAVIKALFVEVAGEQYAIPLVNIDRLVTATSEDIKGRLRFEAIILDNESIPITRLDVLFGEPAQAPEKQQIVIVRRGDKKLGLVVDAFLSTQEIVIKPLHKVIRENQYFSGTTIIGTGAAVLVLDVAHLMLSRRQDLAYRE